MFGTMPSVWSQELNVWKSVVDELCGRRDFADE